jgi:hypothetical protein
MIALALSVALGALPCHDVGALRSQLARNVAEHSWEAALERVKRSAAPLPIEPPSSLAPEKQADWVADRIEASCEAQSVKDVVATIDRGRLGAILARPEFTRDSERGRALVQWISRFFDWLGSLLETSGAQGFAQWTRALVLAAALVVVALGAVRLSRRRRRARTRRAAVEEAPFQLAPAADHLALARARLGTDARDAIRHGWLALLSALERRRLARPDRVKTNREIVAELPQRGASAAIIERVGSIVDWFDLRFYSLAPVAQEDARGFLERVAALASEIQEAR